MIKDEIGFLSEWTAWYELQGFDRVIFYDNNSTSSFEEIQPWVDSGFVTIRRQWWNKSENLFENSTEKFYDTMRIKFLAEIECKMRAIELGIEIFVSVDLDEYLMPTANDMLVIDELEAWFNKTTRGMAIISKLQFPPGAVI